MIGHNTSAGTLIHCRSCRRPVAVVHSISIDLSDKGMKETVTFMDVIDNELFTPEDYVLCKFCNTVWFCKGYFVNHTPYIPSLEDIQRELVNYRESIDYHEKLSSRQGRLLASIADTIANHGDENSELDVNIFHAIRKHLDSELQLLRERVAGRERKSD